MARAGLSRLDPKEEVLCLSQRHQLVTARRFRPLRTCALPGPPSCGAAGAPRLNAEVAKAQLDRVVDPHSSSEERSQMPSAERRLRLRGDPMA